LLFKAFIIQPNTKVIPLKTTFWMCLTFKNVPFYLL
jgi:hypothetical protein